MVERLLLTLVIASLAVAFFILWRRIHLRRASRLSAQVASDCAQPTILYFRGENCGPCQVQSHHLRQLEEDLGDRLTVREIDAERQRDLADRYGVFTLPTTLVTDGNGQVKHVNYGLAASATLARQVEKVL